MIYDKRAATAIIGGLIRRPELLANTDKYLITTEDFEPERLHKLIFSAIYNIFHSGGEEMNLDIIYDYLRKYPELFNFFEEEEGGDFLVGARELGDLKNFDHYYDRVKKLSLLRTIKEEGFDISEWHNSSTYDINERQVLEKKLEDASFQEIVGSYQGRISDIESRFINKKTFQVSQAAEGIRDLLQSLKESPAVGLPLEGEKLTTITRGRRDKKLFAVSGDSGSGKSRFALGNACKLAIPILWNSSKQKWENTGSNTKSLFITTELSIPEIQTIILAYISGVDEDKILNQTLNDKERERLNQTATIMEYFEDNLIIYHLPDPTIAQINSNIRRLTITKKIDNVFYDYIHTSPQLLAEFSGAKVREDVALMLVSTALKNLANELNIFVWTGTQLNKHGVEAEFCDQSSIRGSRAIADKMDFGSVLRPATSEFLKEIKSILQQTNFKPTHMIDVYKNRGSKYTRVRLWIDLDLGTGRSTDLFVTQNGEQVPMDILYTVDEGAKFDPSEILVEKEKKKKENKIEITF